MLLEVHMKSACEKCMCTRQVRIFQQTEPTMSNLPEQRSATRSNVILWGELWIGDLAMPVCVRNISTTGIFLRTSPSVTGAGLVTLRISLPHDVPFFVKGRVVRSQSGIRDLRQAGVSVSFVDLHGHKLEAVERYINHQTNQFISIKSNRHSFLPAIDGCV